MNTRIQPIADIQKRGTDALIREIGVVDTIRFLNQFRSGTGDYTTERQKLFEGLSVRELAAAVKAPADHRAHDQR